MTSIFLLLNGDIRGCNGLPLQHCTIHLMMRSRVLVLSIDECCVNLSRCCTKIPRRGNGGCLQQLCTTFSSARLGLASWQVTPGQLTLYYTGQKEPLYAHVHGRYELRGPLPPTNAAEITPHISRRLEAPAQQKQAMLIVAKVAIPNRHRPTAALANDGPNKSGNSALGQWGWSGRIWTRSVR